MSTSTKTRDSKPKTRSSKRQKSTAQSPNDSASPSLNDSTAQPLNAQTENLHQSAPSAEKKEPHPQDLIDHQLNFPLPLGHLTLLIGHPGIGKSCLALDLAARVSNARPYPPLDYKIQLDRDRLPAGACDGTLFISGQIIYLSTECHDINAVAYAAGIDYQHLATPPERKASLVRRRPNIKGHHELDDAPLMTWLEEKFTLEALANSPPLRLLVLDPIHAFLGAIGSSTSTIREHLLPLLDFAHRREFAVLGISHVNKSRRPADDPATMTLGSTGFTSHARTVLLLTRDRENPLRRLLVPIKNNLSSMHAAYAFTIRGRPRDPARPCDYPPPELVWEKDPILHHPLMYNEHINDAEAAPDNPALIRKSQLDLASEFLRETLKDGPVSTNAVLRSAGAIGLSRGTILRARLRLKVPCFQSNREWLLSLTPQ